jgi:hypothetical protein
VNLSDAGCGSLGERVVRTAVDSLRVQYRGKVEFDAGLELNQASNGGSDTAGVVAAIEWDEGFHGLPRLERLPNLAARRGVP